MALYRNVASAMVVYVWFQTRQFYCDFRQGSFSVASDRAALVWLQTGQF